MGASRERRRAAERDEPEESDDAGEGWGREVAEEAGDASPSASGRGRQRPGLARRLRERRRRSPASQGADSDAESGDDSGREGGESGRESGGGRRRARGRRRPSPQASSEEAEEESDRGAPAASPPRAAAGPRASETSLSQGGANWGLSTSDLPFGAAIAMDVDEDDLDGREQPALQASEVASFVTVGAAGAHPLAAAAALEDGALVAEAAGGQRILRATQRWPRPGDGEDPDEGADAGADQMVSVPLLTRAGVGSGEATRTRSCHVQQPPSGHFRAYSVPAYQRMRRAHRRRGEPREEGAAEGKAGGDAAVPNAGVLKAATTSVRVALGMVFFVAQALLAGTAAVHYYLLLSYASDAAFVEVRRQPSARRPGPGPAC